MEAHEQKHAAAKQSSIVFTQHHQVHLVCHQGNKPAHRDTTTPAEVTNEAESNSLSVILLSLSPSVVCRNEKRGKRRSRRGRSGLTRSERRLWADYDPSERSGSYCLYSTFSCGFSPLIKPRRHQLHSLSLNSIVHLKMKTWLLTTQLLHTIHKFWWQKCNKLCCVRKLKVQEEGKR